MSKERIVNICKNNIFMGKKRILFYGISPLIMEVFQRIVFLRSEILFSDKRLCGQSFMNKEILSVEDTVKELEKGDTILIISAENMDDRIEMKDLLKKLGYTADADFFYVEEFKSYISAYCLQAHGKCYLELLGHVPNWKCTLRCKKCSACIPYINKENPSLQQLTDEIDLLFSKVDYVQTYDCTGGEVFVVSDLLAQMLLYLFEKYGDRFGEVQIVSNATVVPTPDMLFILKRYAKRIHIIISCYNVLDQWNEKYEKFRTVLEEEGICHNLAYAGNWIDFRYQTTDLKLSDVQMREYFDQCLDICRMYADGKYYFCGHGQTAAMAFYPECDNDFLDFSDPELDKKKIVEYNYGILEKGYLDICRHCAKFPNNNVIPVAEQLPQKVQR